MDNNKTYITSFDGIRAFALLSVLFYHLIPSTFKGGYLGVVIFFVLAGYLSMQKVIQIGEIKEDKIKYTLRSFYHKLLKLYPALIIMLLVVTITIYFLFTSQIVNLENTLLGSVLSANNYFQIYSGASYFENTGALLPFTHIWALSLEVQFYVLIYAFLHGRYKSKNKFKLFVLLIIISTLSYVLSIFLLEQGYDYTRIYYGLFTRLYSFTLGMIASFFSLKNRADMEILSSWQRDILIFILFALLFAPVFMFDANHFIFKYGFMIYSLLSTFILILLSSDNSKSSKLFSNSLFSLLTKRSYHIYLWHFPIIALEDRYFANIDVSKLVYYGLFFASCIILSELTYWLNKLVTYSKGSKICTTIIVLTIATGAFFVPYKEIAENTAENKALKEMKAQILENEKLQRERTLDSAQDDKVELSIYDEKAILIKERFIDYAKNNKAIDIDKIAADDPVLQNALNHIEWVNSLNDDFLYLDPKEYVKYKDVKGLLIGDSLASMSYHTLYTYMPNFEYDSEHSRQMKDAYKSFKKYKKSDFGEYLILSLGTNGSIFHKDINKINDALKSNQKIILLSIVLPYKDEEESRNNHIREYAQKHDNVYLVDWYQAAKNRPEIFFDDKIHPDEDGAKVLGQIIIKKIIEIEKSK